MLKFKNLEFNYYNCEQKLIIDELEIKKGELVVLIGVSGSGKTTFTRILNALVFDYYKGNIKGEIQIPWFNDRSIENVSKYVASVFQNPATQFFHQFVEDELVFALEYQQLEKEEIKKRLDSVLDIFNLNKLGKQKLNNLSGGQKQRIAIASSLMRKPELIVMDEPSSNLDLESIELIKNQMLLLKKLNKTIVVSEHRISYLKDIADKFLYFDKGKLIKIYSKDEFLKLDDLKRQELGLRSLKPQTLKQKISNSTNGLYVKNTIIDYGKGVVNKINSFSANYNEITAIVGRNGCGKSSFARMLVGLIKFDSEMYLDNIKIGDVSKHSFLLMQDVRKQLFFEKVIKEIKFNIKKTADFDGIVKILELDSILDKHPVAISGGQQQRILLANAILSDKKIIILDEPTSGLDYHNMLKVAELLNKLKKDRIVIIISHDVEFINACADKIQLF